MEKYIYLEDTLSIVDSITVFDVLSEIKYVFTDKPSKNKTNVIFINDIITNIDSYSTIQKKIETYCKIPIIYQLIYNPATNIPIDTSINFPIPKNLILTPVIFKEKESNIQKFYIHTYYVLNAYDYIKTLGTESSFDASNSLYNDILRYYWPLLKYSDYQYILSGKRLLSDKYNFEGNNKFIYLMNSITLKNINDNMDVDNVNKVSMNLVTVFNKNFDTEYIFDQFILSNKYCNIYYKESFTKILRKYIRQKKIDYTYPNKIGEVKIGHDIFIYNDNVDHSNNDIINILMNLFPDMRIIRRIEEHKYMFIVKLARGLTFNIARYKKIISGISSDVVEHNLLNIGNRHNYSMYYKKVESYNDSQTEEFNKQTGVLIRLNGDNIISVISSKIISMDDMKTVYNFVCRTLYIYVVNSKEYYNEKLGYIISNTKGMMKIVDPTLYAFNKKVSSDIVLYTKRVPKKKYPIIFHEGSKILSKFIKYMKLSGQKNVKMLRYKNYTYKNKYSIYLCLNKKYPHFQLRQPTEHPNRICAVSCCVKDRSNDALYKKCMIGKPFNISDINENVINNKSNLFYIKNFKLNKTLFQNKISLLPDILNKLLNKKTNIFNNLVKSGSSGYFLYGSSDDRNFYTTIQEQLPFVPVIKNTARDEQWNISNHYFNHGINPIIFTFNADNNKLIFKRIISNYSLLKSFDSRKSVVILKIISEQNEISRFNSIIELSSIKHKKYSVKSIFVSTDPIIIYIKKLLKSMIVDEDEHDFVSCKNLSVAEIKYIQIRTLQTNIITNVIIYTDKGIWVPFPVIPSLLDIDITYFDADDNIIVTKYLKDYTYKNVRDGILYVIKKLKNKDKIHINGMIVDIYGNYTGFNINEGFTIGFDETKKVDSIYAKMPKIIRYVDQKDLLPVKDKYNSELKLMKELYAIFVYHVSKYLNKNSDKRYNKFMQLNKKDMIDELLRVYGDSNNSLFKEDYHKLSIEQFSAMEYFKIYKLELRNAINKSDLKEIKSIISSIIPIEYISYDADTKRKLLLSKYIRICSDTESKYTISNQCNSDKLYISKKSHKLFVDLISNELLHNSIRRYEIMYLKTESIHKMKFKTTDKDIVYEIIDLDL